MLMYRVLLRDVVSTNLFRRTDGRGLAAVTTAETLDVQNSCLCARLLAVNALAILGRDDERRVVVEMGKPAA